MNNIPANPENIFSENLIRVIQMLSEMLVAILGGKSTLATLEIIQSEEWKDTTALEIAQLLEKALSKLQITE